MLAAAHTLTAISRDLPQRLLFPDAPNLRNEFGGGTEAPLRATKSQAHFGLPVPTKGQAGSRLCPRQGQGAGCLCLCSGVTDRVESSSG